MKSVTMESLDKPHRIYIDVWRCTVCQEEFPLNSKEIKNGRHVPTDRRKNCGSQARLVKRYHGQTKGLGFKEIFNMDIREFYNTRIVWENGHIYIRKSE